MNRLNEKLAGLVVMTRHISDERPGRVFVCESGPGCDPMAKGDAIVGCYYSDDPAESRKRVTISGVSDITRRAEQKEMKIINIHLGRFQEEDRRGRGR